MSVIIQRSAIIFLICLTLVTPAYAGDDAFQTIRDNCNTVESPLDVASACDSHIECLFSTANTTCLETTLVNLMTSCDNIDIYTCADLATLTLIAMDDTVNHFETSDSTQQLNGSIRAFVAGDNQTAIDLYENVTLALDYFPHYLFELGLGVLYSRFDNPDRAIIHYDESLLLEFYNPIAFYYRGRIYSDLQATDRALRDYYLYDLLADPTLKSNLPLDTFRIQLADFDLWTLYPIYEQTTGDSGATLTDKTLEPATNITLTFLNDGDLLAVSNWIDFNPNIESEIIFLQRDPQNPLRYILEINQQDIPGAIQSPKQSINILVSPARIDAYHHRQSGNTDSLTSFILLPVIEPDARLAVTNRFCDNLPLAQLELNDKIQLVSPESELIVYDDPTVRDVIAVATAHQMETAKTPFAIVEGPVCYDNLIWWKVTNDTVGGWVTENSEQDMLQYHLISRTLYDAWQDHVLTPSQFLRADTSPD